MTGRVDTRLRVVGLGAGGHARVVLDSIGASGDFEVVGLLDVRPQLRGAEIMGVRVLGDDSLVDELRRAGVSHAFVGVGGADDTRPRRRLYEWARLAGLDVVSVVHPAAVVSRAAELGPGATVLAAAVVNAGARLGENVTLNSGAIVEHDCVLEDHVHVATGARLASSVTVGAGAHVGAGATVIQGVRVGEGAVVGAGAVVVTDVEPQTVVVGVPARYLRAVEP